MEFSSSSVFHGPRAPKLSEHQISTSNWNLVPHQGGLKPGSLPLNSAQVFRVSIKQTFLVGLWLVLGGNAFGQSNVISFRTTAGEYFSAVKVGRIEDDGVLYTFTTSGGGGKIRFSD